MAVLPIRQYLEDPVLRRKAKAVTKIDKSVQRLINDMVETMHQAQGVGLAAPQVSVSLRIVVIEVPDNKLIALINPEIIKRTGVQAVNEGCLSVPGYWGELTRSAEVIVGGKNRQGKAVRIKATGLMAEAFEHEVDHLNGVLYIDRVGGPEKLHTMSVENSMREAG